MRMLWITSAIILGGLAALALLPGAPSIPYIYALLIVLIATGIVNLILVHRAQRRIAAARAALDDERRQVAEARVDPGSGLLTFHALEQIIEAERETSGEAVHLAVLRIDHFERVRVAIGYTLTASLVRAFGQRVAERLPEAPIARIAPDCIAVAIRAPSDAAAIDAIRAIHPHVEGRFALDGHQIDLTVTIGAATDRPREPVVDLLERAQMALHLARTSRRRIASFGECDYASPDERLDLMNDLRRSLGQGDLHLAYQPKMRARTGEIDGVEALIRWTHATRGLIAPGTFIPMSEESGDIRAVTEWTLMQVVRDQALLAAAGFPTTIYVNISAWLLTNRNFAEAALDLVRGRSGTIGFEITETAMIKDPEEALDTLRLFADAGIRIAIDDYGSGMSSLAYLKELPAQELKIDRMFIAELTRSHRDPLLVRSTIDLAHGLGMEVTAEGVDSPSALALLRVMGCDLIQGFLVAHPMPLDELIRFLRDERKLAHLEPATPRLGRVENYW